MFNDALYYLSIFLHGKSFTILVAYMNMDEFVIEYVKRFNETPKISHMVTLSEDEYDTIIELIKNPDQIFEGEDE
jgi:phage regulator Rha-like protein